jgi:hypothetical protein
MTDIDENSNMIITIKEWDRLTRIEKAAKAVVPYGMWRIYFWHKAPVLQALRAALYGEGRGR